MYQPLIKFHPYPAIITQVLCIFAGYRIRMKREILYQRIAGTIAWQTDTLFYILTGTDIRINQHLRTGNEIKREITVRIQP